MENYKNKLGSLADRLMTEKPNVPIQEVTPIKIDQVLIIKESRFNNWIPQDLKKRVKAFAVEHEISLKELTIVALEDFLKFRHDNESSKALTRSSQE